MLWRSSTRFFSTHPAQTLLALTGIAGGVAVVTGVALLYGLLSHGLDAALPELSATDGVRLVGGAGGLPEQAFAELARQPGAPDMVAVVSARVTHEGRPMELIGADVAALLGREGLALPPAVSGSLLTGIPVALVSERTARSAGWAPGGIVSLQRRGRTHTVQLVAVIPLSSAWDDRVLMDIAPAQVLFGTAGELSMVLAPGEAASWLRAHLPAGWRLVEDGDHQRQLQRLTRGLRANLAALSLLAMAVGLFVVFGVFSFLLVQRKHSFGVLRALGVERGRLVRALAAEGTWLGLIGGSLGLLAGVGLAHLLLDLVRVPVAEIYQQLPAAGFSAPVWLFPLILLLGLMAVLGALLPLLLEAGRIRPSAWLRPEAAPARTAGHGWWAVALMTAGVLFIVITTGLPPALAGLFLILAGLALVIPAAGVRMLCWAARLGGAGLVGRALGLLVSGARRIRPALAALTLAVAVTGGVGMMIAGFRVSVDDWLDRLLRADVYLTLSRGVIDEHWVAQVAASGVVEHVSGARRATVAPDRVLVAYDLPPPAWAGFTWVAGEMDEARRARFGAGEGVLVSEPLARRLELVPGTMLELDTPHGPRAIEVLAVFRDYSSERGFIALDGAVYRRLWADPVRDNLGLYLASGVDEARLRHALADKVPDIEAIRLADRAAVREQTLAVFDRTFRVTRAMQVLLGAIALIALLSAFLALALERARDYATLRAVGMTPAGVAFMVMVQTLALGLMAAVLAVPVALLLHVLLTGVVQPRAFGWSLPLNWPWRDLLAVLPWVLLAAALAGVYPARRLARVDPARALREAR